MAAIAESVRISARGRPGWSRGLTKETSPILAEIARKVSVAQRGRKVGPAALAALAAGRFNAAGQTKETSPIIAARARRLSQLYSGRENPKHGERMRRFYAENPDKHPNAIVAKKTKGKGFTHIEKCVAEHLDALGVTYRFNVRIGRMWPDFSISSHALLIEADGEYWHQDATKEAARDAYLESLGWRVLHLPGKMLMNDPNGCRASIEAAPGASRGAR